MNQFVDFFKGLFATDKWPARWHCGEWSNFHGWLYIISDLLIWLAYFLIPIIILEYFSRKKGTIKFTKAYLLFAMFILLCGGTHFMDAVMFWVPLYRVNALLRLITGLVSLATVYYLIKILPQAFNQRTNIELENEIAKRVAAERLLAEANHNLESFVYIASHDLQEPLRKIRDHAAMIHKNDSAEPGQSNMEIASKITSATVRMQRMIQDILTLSTMSSEIDLGKVDVNKSIVSALKDLEIKIEEKNAELSISKIPNIKGNSTYITQLFINLLSNALKFSDRNPIIDISSEVEGSKVVIAVKDNGIGIGEEYLEKIFTAFQKPNLASEQEGSGMGLAISKRIVDLHNGKISVKSKVGVGTTFFIELPL